MAARMNFPSIRTGYSSMTNDYPTKKWVKVSVYSGYPKQHYSSLVLSRNYDLWYTTVGDVLKDIPVAVPRRLILLFYKDGNSTWPVDEHDNLSKFVPFYSTAEKYEIYARIVFYIGLRQCAESFELIESREHQGMLIVDDCVGFGSINKVLVSEEDKDMEEICRQKETKHLEKLKIRFLTKEEDLDPFQMSTIEEVKEYVRRNYEISCYHQLLIIYNKQEIHDDQTRILDLFEHETGASTEMHLNVLSVEKPFDVNFILLYPDKMLHATEKVKCYDTISEIKMKLTPKHYPEQFLSIQNHITEEFENNSHNVTDFFTLTTDDIFIDNILADNNTIKQCGIKPYTRKRLCLVENVLICINFGEEAPEQMIEYRLRKDSTFDYFDVDLKQILNHLREKYGVRKKELHLVPGQNGVEKEPIFSGKFERLSK